MGGADLDAEALSARLKGRLFLSSMMGITHGVWSAEHGRGGAMVQLGAYVLDAPGERSGPSWPDSDEAALAAHLEADFDEFRRLHGGDEEPVVCANMFLCHERSLETSARALMAAGGELYELNAHGGIGGDRENGTGRYMFLPEHEAKLHEWVRRLCATGVPLVVKARGGVIPAYGAHVKRFEEAGVFAFHINVRDEDRGVQVPAWLEEVRKGTSLFLLASGYVTDAESARRLFDAGADAVGIAEAVRHDPEMLFALKGQI